MLLEHCLTNSTTAKFEGRTVSKAQFSVAVTFRASTPHPRMEAAKWIPAPISIHPTEDVLS